ncbi:orotidine-5'-phosphate decarboxylase [Corynebacterium sp. HS2168-gen11]|uniref:orotidine-5'-phosphate decarboxylase n=1 Tax=Corynebacterium sp. HS2168-gen11 TaxID=2974027 RepID=UPI00216B648B|nr:orotidine-5'-phosphate decarboxylase [Corynebacterium sp. HS2168-gen11]MCS4535154.1 orotidine-5'-phosphate decarboxylase [Corynebacterium sp. HS2168-gen11]
MTTPLSFGDRLLAAGRTHGRLCVGIDPHKKLLEQWGLEYTVAGLQTFTNTCVEAFAGHVALVKPQVAFYEAFGAQGYQVLEEAITALRAAGTLVVADAKRGDIGSTMAGYATAWLDPESPLACDAVTLSPYLGFDSLRPALELADATGTGVFVLAATSNPEARHLQDHRDATGATISQQIVDAAAKWNAPAANNGRIGNVGVVVGATLATAPTLAALNGPVLLPGVGAQGATSADVARLTTGVDELGFANISRQILGQGPNVSALRQACIQASQEFA